MAGCSAGGRGRRAECRGPRWERDFSHGALRRSRQAASRLTQRIAAFPASRPWPRPAPFRISAASRQPLPLAGHPGLVPFFQPARPPCGYVHAWRGRRPLSRPRTAAVGAPTAYCGCSCQWHSSTSDAALGRGHPSTLAGRFPAQGKPRVFHGAIMNKHQVKVLSNLRPETVVGRLRMKVDTEERMVAMVRFVVAGGLCFDEDGEHCNPLADGYANGRIHHRGRRARRDEELSFFEALGCDSDGNQDLTDECVSDQLVAHVVSSIRKNRPVMTTLSNLRRGRGKAASWDAVLKTIADAGHRGGGDSALDYVAEWFLDVPRWADLEPGWRDQLADLLQLLSEGEAQAAWERALAAGSIGNPLAVLLDIYEQ